MKVAVLFSGGKDSNYALFKASKEHEISALITLKSKNKESYMFQTPGVDFVKFQAKCLGIPQIVQTTSGEKELELEDLKKAILKAKTEFKIEAVVTGAIKSVYQATRIQKICDELNLYCFNPLWQIDETSFLRELLKNQFKIKIIAIASYPLTEKYLGKTIDDNLKENLLELNKTYKLSPIGEGGEFESFVIDSPLFTSYLKFETFKIISESENSAHLQIEEIKIVKK